LNVVFEILDGGTVEVKGNVINTASLETTEIGDEGDEPGKSVAAVGDGRRAYTNA
jgi:hypothetical protein